MICEHCTGDHAGGYGSGRFCSSACARAFSTSKNRSEVNKKISSKLKGKPTGNSPKNKLPLIEINVPCVVCELSFPQIIKGEHGKRRKTCSEACHLGLRRIQGRNSAKAQAENRRSKNEKYFAELCTKHFRSVSTNSQQFNGWDADVILNEEKIAILWNGRWHYEKITASHSVEQVQNRDKIKIKEIEKCGFTPYVIKDMGGFNPKLVEEEFGGLVKWLSRGSHKAE